MFFIIFQFDLRSECESISNVGQSQPDEKPNLKRPIRSIGPFAKIIKLEKPTTSHALKDP